MADFDMWGRRGGRRALVGLALLGSAGFLAACIPGVLPLRRTGEGVRPADPAATAETRALYANLARLAPEGVLFGHQEALAYGVNWRGERGRSDVRDVTGSYPAVYGGTPTGSGRAKASPTSRGSRTCSDGSGKATAAAASSPFAGTCTTR